MKNTAKKIKSSIKKLSARKVSTTIERKTYKKKASKQYKKSKEYQYWFELSDEARVDLRYEIRHHLLAYALLRGREYKTVEKKCALDNKPSIRAIEGCIDDHKDFETPEHAKRLEELKASVKQWLEVPATEGPPELKKEAA